MSSQQTDMAARVWKRVQDGAPSLQERQTLQKLIALLQADVLFLKKQTVPAAGKLLAEQLADQAKVLRGIQVLATGNPAGTAPQHQPTHHLNQCYQHALDRLNQYLLRTADPQFSPVYTQLARETRQHCRMIAGLAAQGR